jgi:ParB family transcriptional regulator, chromosome partitioning protein
MATVASTLSNNPPGDHIFEILTEKVIPSPFQPRRHFDQERLKELGESIRVQGLVQPIVVRSVEGSDTFELIAGERRLRAHRLIEQKTVRAIVKRVSSEEARSMTLIENLQREDLTLMEEAKCLYDLLESLGGNHQAVAEKVGKGLTYVDDRLLLVNLPREVQNMIDDKKINMAQAKVIAEVPEEKEQVAGAKLAAKLNLSANELRGRLQRALKPKTARPTSGEGEGATVKFNQVSSSLVRLYDLLDKFNFDMLRDAKKRETLTKQIGVLEKALQRAKARLAAAPVAVASEAAVSNT